MDYLDGSMWSDDVIEKAERSQIGDMLEKALNNVAIDRKLKACSRKSKRYKRRSSHSPTSTNRRVGASYSRTEVDPDVISTSRSWNGPFRQAASNESSRRSSSKLLSPTCRLDWVLSQNLLQENSSYEPFGGKTTPEPKSSSCWSFSPNLRVSRILGLGGSDNGLYHDIDNQQHKDKKEESPIKGKSRSISVIWQFGLRKQMLKDTLLGRDNWFSGL